MALLQISEPGQAAAPHEHKLAVGIDLGTTNSLVATVRSGSASVLDDQVGDTMLPSVVNYSAESAPEVGRAAFEKIVTDPLNTLALLSVFWVKAVPNCKRSPLSHHTYFQIRVVISALFQKY